MNEKMTAAAKLYYKGDLEGLKKMLADATTNEELARITFFIACCYFKRGDAQGDEEAKVWFEKGSALGDVLCKLGVADFYEDDEAREAVYGEGVKQDYKKAAEWYAKAAEQGMAYLD
jgi:TPR repeat protein